MIRSRGAQGRHRKRRLQRAAALGTLGVGVALAGFLVLEGLDRAVQWASVLGLFVNAVGVLAAVAAVWLAWRTHATIGGELADELEAEPLKKSDPRKIGDFRLLGRVGSGAMGVVYLGRTPTGTFAAVKVMRSELADDATFRKRFKRELRDIGQVKGSHFPPLLNADADAEQPWLATEYFPGLPLDEVIKVGVWPLEAVAWLACGIAEALEVIHTEDIVHRDLKPSNVLLDEDGPQIIDFGIAQAMQDTKVTKTGTLWGTVAFMAPEQTRVGTGIGPAADVFSLGSLLVYAATGRPPFGEIPEHAVMCSIREEEPDLGKLADMDDPITDLIRACLNKEPAKRPSPSQIIATCRAHTGSKATGWLPEGVQSRIDHRRTVIGSLPQQPNPEGPLHPPRPLPKDGSPKRRGATTLKVVVPTVLAVLVVLGFMVVPTIVREPVLPPCAGPADTTLRVAASADKSHLLKQMAKDYGTRATDGHCVQVVVVELNSGQTMASLARGWADADGPRPDVWSPASSEWLTMAQQRASKAVKDVAVLPAEATASIVTTPLVIAMPKPMADALGWPRNDIGWNELANLATDEQGWRRYGKDWGPFRLGKTNPNYSTSGLNATIGAFYAYTKQASKIQDNKLEERDIDNPGAQDFVRRIEQSIVHYGETTLDFLRNLRRVDDERQALSYISAVTVDENSMLAYNNGYPSGTSADEKMSPPDTKLVAIYPREGTIYHDHPYIELSWPENTPAKRATAKDFLKYLHSTRIQSWFQQFGFRDYQNRHGPLATLDNGTDPNAKITQLTVPQAPVLDKVLATWTALRKPANVLLIIDTSGSMDEGVTHRNPKEQACTYKNPDTNACPTKLELVKMARKEIAAGFTDKDRVGLWKFSLRLDDNRDYQELRPVSALGELGGKELASKIGALTTDTDTGLYDTIDAAVQTIMNNSDKNAINAVVALSDGKDTEGGDLESRGLLRRLEPQPGQEPVRVFTIAYGLGPDEDRGRTDLQKIAETTRAARYDAQEVIVEDLVAAIISNF